MASVLLSIEPMGYDGVIRAYAETHRFDFGGIDANRLRDEVRLGFSHFSGVNPALDSFRIPKGDRRRFVVLDTTTPENKVLFITNDYRSAKSAEVMAAVDSVILATAAGPSDDPYAEWLAGFGLDAEGGSDPDDDGSSTALEFFFNSDPTDPNSFSGPEVRLQPGLGRVLEYQSRSDLGGLEAWIEFSRDLATWQALEIPETAKVVMPVSDSKLQTTILLDMVKAAGTEPDSGLHLRIAVGQPQ